jgi:hypothetical protein
MGELVKMVSRPKGFYKKDGVTHPIMGRGTGRKSHAFNLGKPSPASFRTQEEKEEVDWQAILDRVEYYAWNASDDPIKTLEDASRNIDQWLKDNEVMSKEDKEKLKWHLQTEAEETQKWAKNNKAEYEAGVRSGRVDVEYFLKNARAADINGFLSAHPEYLSLFIALRESGRVEAAKVGGKPVEISPSRVIVNNNRR